MTGVSLVLGSRENSDLTADITGFWKSVMDSVANEHARAKRLQDEVIHRETKFLQGSLTTFLATPLRSDLAEINQLHMESITRAVESVAGPGDSPVVAWTMGIITMIPALRGGDRRLTVNTRRFLDGESTGAENPAEDSQTEIFLLLRTLPGVELLGRAIQPAAAGHPRLRVCGVRVLELVGESSTAGALGQRESVVVFLAKEEDSGQPLWGELAKGLDGDGVGGRFSLWRNGLIPAGKQLYELRVRSDVPQDAAAVERLISLVNEAGYGDRLAAGYTRTIVSSQGEL